MNEIISFTDRAKEVADEIIWKCDCGNCAFILHVSQAIECSKCGVIQSGSEMETTLRNWTRKVREGEDDE